MKTLSKLVCGITAVSMLLISQSTTRATVLVNETFSYADGGLTQQSAGVWSIFSGALPDIQVTNGQAEVSQLRAPDDSISLGGAQSSNTLYASFTLDATALPALLGGYFALFKDAGTANFRDRIYVTTNGAAAGTFRIGVANASGTAAIAQYIATDLSLNTSYQIVTRLDMSVTNPSLGTNINSTIWLNPILETDPSVTATDISANTIAMTTFGLRESTATGSGMGVLLIDNLRVATTFAEVVPEPSTIMLVGVGLVGMLALRRRRK